MKGGDGVPIFRFSVDSPDDHLQTNPTYQRSARQCHGLARYGTAKPVFVLKLCEIGETSERYVAASANRIGFGEHSDDDRARAEVQQQRTTRIATIDAWMNEATHPAW